MTEDSIVIIDHGQGNIGSLVNTLSYLDMKYEVWRSIGESKVKEGIRGFILPGVGSFDEGMKEIRKRELDKVVYRLLDEGIKGMGICLGMQMLCKTSEESKENIDGLGIIDGHVKKLDCNEDFVPNIGWNQTFTRSKSFDYLRGTFYYVHSYAVTTGVQELKTGYFMHGKDETVAAVHKSGILGVQFHPEKSQAAGLKLLKKYF